MKAKSKMNFVLTALFSIISLAYIFPIALVVINSFKKKAYISRKPFEIPTGNMFVGLENYIRGMEKTQFFTSFGTSLFITVASVALIILCTSMCAWYIVRVHNKFTSGFYYLCLFSMIVYLNLCSFVFLERIRVNIF